MAHSSAPSQSPPARPAGTLFRPLNAFMAFRSHFNKMLPNMQQKERSGVLTALWKTDPYKNKWTMVAKVFSYLRAELGKDAVSLPTFLEHACRVLGIPPLDTYLQQRGFALLENETGHLTLIPRTEMTTFTSSPQSTFSSEGGGEIHNGAINGQNLHADVKLDYSYFQECNMSTNDNFPFQEHCSGQGIPVVEESTPGLFAEHQLLEAVFDKGLEVDLSRLENDDSIDDHKQWLVQKLCTMAHEMLIGGENPIVLGDSKVSGSTKGSPVTAVSQLFSQTKDFAFDVLVIDSDSHVKNHLLCQINLDGTGNQTTVPASKVQTNETRTILGSFNTMPRKQIQGHGLSTVATNSTPTYTQNMAYQSSSHTGKFHVFSSQPSQLGKSIITSTPLSDCGSPCFTKAEFHTTISEAKSCSFEDLISPGHNFVRVNHMEYDLGDSVVNAGTVGAVESDGGGESNSVTSLLSTSRRGSQDYLSDDGTLVASEHDHSDGHSDGGMSSWIARELELHYNGSNATTATNNDIEETDQPTHLETVSPLCSSFRQQTPSASSLGKRSRENSDVDSETLTGNGTTTQVHPDNDAGSPSSTTSSAANQCRAAKKIMTSKPEAHHRDIRRHATMAPPLHPRSPLEYDRAPSPQPLESPHAVQVQPREGLPEHLFAGSFEKDFRDDFARPKPAEQTSRDNITLKIATGELEGDSGPSTAAPASASFPDIGQAEQLSPPAQKTPVTTSAPATTSTATVSPIVLPDVLSVLASRRYSVHGDNQELTAGQRSANNHHLNHHRLDHHHRAVSQDPAHQAQLQYQNFDMDMSLQRLQGMEAAPRSSQTIRSYQSMQAMHAKQAAQELQALQNMEAVDAFSSAQGLPGMPLISPELLEATMPSMPAPSNQHRQLPLLENTPSYVGYNFQPDMPSEVQTEVVEEYSETDQFEIPDMAVTGMGMVDFANPEEIARVMGGINDTESGHDSFRAVHFPWPPN